MVIPDLIIICHKAEIIAPIVLYMRPGKGKVSNSWAFELMKMTELVLPSSSTKVYLVDCCQPYSRLPFTWDAPHTC